MDDCLDHRGAAKTDGLGRRALPADALAGRDAGRSGDHRKGADHDCRLAVDRDFPWARGPDCRKAEDEQAEQRPDEWTLEPRASVRPRWVVAELADVAAPERRDARAAMPRDARAAQERAQAGGERLVRARQVEPVSLPPER